MRWQAAHLGEVADVNWGDTSVTKAAYVAAGHTAYSASGPDGFLPYADFDRTGVVLSAIGARCGKTWFAHGKWSCIKNTIRFWSTSPGLDNRYLYWATANEDFFPKRGAAQPFITIGDARATEILLPPLDEQRRIAAILDKADALRQKRKRAIALLESLTQSIFFEMFGDPVTNDRQLPLVELANLEAFLTSGSRGWAKYYAPAGRAFIRIQNLKAGQLDTNDLAYVQAPDGAESRRTTVSEGDVLVSITADLGRVAVVPPELSGRGNINQHLALFRPRGIDPVYLAHYLASPGGQRQFASADKGGVKAGLNFDDIRRMSVPLPPQTEQKSFRLSVQHVENSKKRFAASLASIESLFSTLQHRAFSGELERQ